MKINTKPLQAADERVSVGQSPMQPTGQSFAVPAIQQQSAPPVTVDIRFTPDENAIMINDTEYLLINLTEKLLS